MVHRTFTECLRLQGTLSSRHSKWAHTQEVNLHTPGTLVSKHAQTVLKVKHVQVTEAQETNE